jgi:molybdopterin-guanine dinucleotide biosynthesis protein A
LLPASLFACMLTHARVTGRALTVASVNGFAQTFPAVLDKGVLPFLEGSIHAERRGCYTAFQAAAAALGEPVSVLPVEILVQTGQAADPYALPPARWFINVNSEADLARAESILGALNSSSGEGRRRSIA